MRLAADSLESAALVFVTYTLEVHFFCFVNHALCLTQASALNKVLAYSLIITFTDN